MAILIKSDHMVSVYLLLFKEGNHKYAILDYMTFLFIVKWPYENQHDYKPLKVTIKWPYDEFGVPYDSFMVIPHPQCKRGHRTKLGVIGFGILETRIRMRLVSLMWSSRDKESMTSFFSPRSHCEYYFILLFDIRDDQSRAQTQCFLNLEIVFVVVVKIRL